MNAELLWLVTKAKDAQSLVELKLAVSIYAKEQTKRRGLKVLPGGTVRAENDSTPDKKTM